MREILNDIFTWPWFSEPHGYNFNGHLIRHVPKATSASTPSSLGKRGSMRSPAWASPAYW